jgi:hypothetical protein
VTENQYVTETIGSGAGWIDFDGDGYLDLLLINSAPMPGAAPPDSSPLNALYRNRSGESFDDLGDRPCCWAPGFGQGIAVGDWDNDGFDDVYLTFYREPNRSLQNHGDGTFTIVTHPADPTTWSTSCAFGDLDGDGDLDLYVCHYLDMPIEGYPFCGDKKRNIRTVCSPSKFPGQADAVYRNDGDGTWTDASEAWGFRPEDGRGLGVVIADLDEDGLPDVFVANDLSPNLLYRNLGGGRFSEQGLLSGCALSADGRPQAGMGVDAGDIDGDGRLDIFVTNFFREPNSLYHNLGGGLFREISGRSGLGRPSYLKLGFGCGFLDADNDGRLDVFVSNGHIDRNPEAHGSPEPYRQVAQLFMGDGRGRFAEASVASAGPYFAEPHVGRAAAFGDYDNDGRMDIAVNHNGEPCALLHNESPMVPDWVRIRLVGTTDNRTAIGTRVLLEVGGARQVVQLMGGRSYLSAHDPRLLIAAGERIRDARLEIRWPSGRIEAIEGLTAGTTMTIREACK